MYIRVVQVTYYHCVLDNEHAQSGNFANFGPKQTRKMHENPFIRFSVMLLTEKEFLEKYKRNRVCKGLNIPPPKLSRFFLVSCPAYPENFMNIRKRVFL